MVTFDWPLNSDIFGQSHGYLCWVYLFHLLEVVLDILRLGSSHTNLINSSLANLQNLQIEGTKDHETKATYEIP